MIFSIKELTDKERALCEKTLSSKAIYALVGDALTRKVGLSIVRMGDGEGILLKAKDDSVFAKLDADGTDWCRRMGVAGMPLDALQKSILDAGNNCTYFAPSVSGISYKIYNLYDYFEPRQVYLDNFFVNDWTKEMIGRLLAASGGATILHGEHEQIIRRFRANYGADLAFEGFPKLSWRDNDAAIEAAVKSPHHLVLFSGGPAGKVIGPKIAAAANKVVLDIGNTLIPWSEMK